LRKKGRNFNFFVITCLIIACLFLFSSLIFSGEVPRKETSSPPSDGQEKIEESKKEEEPDKESPGNLPAAEQNENPKLFPSRGKEVQFKWDDVLLEKISFLQSPIPGAQVTSRDSQLPGAPRPYRNGIHEGLDYYSGSCGITINFGDPVFAAGPGIVYRIDHDYLEPDMKERDEILKICKERKDTPEDILDKLRGRQIWLTHPYGVITRYAHLNEVAAHLQEGDLVEAGDFIGTIGNSGTSDGAGGNTLNPHLHFEIWISGSYPGEGLSPREIRELWKRVLEN
jgi:murein DD-endopeptidase MepM/ murein hydrolase activator NlpD